MIEVQGIITAVDADHAMVSIQGEGCGRCHDPGGCGGSNLSQMFCSTPKNYRVLNSRKANVGDVVMIVIGDHTLLRSILVGYGLPLFCVFSGAAIGLVSTGETGSMLGAACGLLASWRIQKLQAVKEFYIGHGSGPRIK